MRLKIFEFDVANSQLYNSETQSLLHLTRTECQVLEQLALHPNQVMSKGQLACAGSQQPLMSESAVAKAVFTLRKYFGEQHADLIETLPRKGYRLNLETPKADWVIQAQKRKRQFIALGVVCTIGLMVLILAMHQYIWFKSAPAPIKHHKDIELVNHHRVTVTWLESPSIQPREGKSIETKVIAALGQCPTVTWQRVYLALSNDMQVLNISLMGKGTSGQLLVRNIKTSDFSLSPRFITQDWLSEVSLCD
ncbi:transcriptional regulator [Shewanella waksmanii]|uniref:winged helix-turn-helix domain-containing protein n=1 Tax=Shewanella waksmanii TaxID=213783 RepID=UPI0037365DC0